MSKRFYFAIKDGCYDPETGETDEAGLCVDFDGPDAPEDAIRLAEQQFLAMPDGCARSPRKNISGTSATMNNAKENYHGRHHKDQYRRAV